ncbi:MULTISPECIES: MobA/MobL family protein [unclassified Lentilitoribacter]|uniref:MobA/MobL family protein n=1 Tax=unclassified Lentilitoribacter TaxID=2647570 RepID=UPI0013A6CA4A|nr:MobA/MobL family protein [Lentilitoribacter sp. Alg239-R112]
MQDGNIHCHIGNVSAKNEDVRQRSAIVAASYQSGETLFSDKRNKEIIARDAGDDDVIFAEIFAPNGTANWAKNRAQLWNAVEKNAKRKDSRLAKKIEAAFTRDVPARDRIQLLKDFIKPFVAMGCVVDVAIHNDPKDHNPHAHILLTTFALDRDGFSGKITAIDTRKFITETRKAWADITNLYLEKSGSSLRVDHRSYKARGIEAEPTKHRGPHRDASHHHENTSQPIVHEHAQVEETSNEMERPEQESDMQEPTQTDKELYPNLTQRDDWPPKEVPTHDMKLAEREELHRYWQDQKLERIEEQELVPPEYEAQSLELDVEQTSELQQDATYIPQDDRASRHELYKQDLEMDAARRERIENAQKSVYLRASNMYRTYQEKQLLEEAAEMGKYAVQAAKDVILMRRMQEIQRQDDIDRIGAYQKAIKQPMIERLKNYLQLPEAENDHPVPGPYREPRHPKEMDEAMNEMIQELEREPEQDRER